ncbi:YceD family protein [Sabulicella glaciei]|uniref:DUF177 domain-containing protein n=1 Tax=Sabulicella glaciei TaxID=2984948 RepID=A0ABT3NYK3_9PROT|nr:YceD family protein [Roseococcus sp. MDT2-1-1]MCW8087246.1 DUF177 domain-containing protein [Roseococcus sp. MDT2-1-1]
MSAEFHHPLVLANVPSTGLSLRLVPDAAQREALARRFGLLAIHSMEGELRLAPESGGRIAVLGTIRAEVEQECVVSLAPLQARVEEGFAWRLLPDGVEPSDEDEDPDDIPSEDGVVDLGETLAQQLSLALDPYPRAPGAELPEEGVGDAAHGPFAALSRLRKPQ